MAAAARDGVVEAAGRVLIKRGGSADLGKGRREGISARTLPSSGGGAEAAGRPARLGLRSNRAGSFSKKTNFARKKNLNKI